MNYGLDVGTNMIVAATVDPEGKPLVRMQRDAFYRIVPKSEVNRNGIRMSLERRGANFIEDGADFIIVGEDALEMAIERNDIAKRPLKKGVISPREKDSLPMLKLIIESLVGKGNGDDQLVYSVPARPIDSDFDIVYHKEMLEYYIGQMGYKAFALNEAYAIGLSELLDEGLTGICLSYGAGMTNIAVIIDGASLLEFSVTRAGDFIDESVGKALDISPSLVQMEKEAGVDLLKPQDKIMEAVGIYYNSVINYTLQNIAYELKRQKDKGKLPMFRNPVPVIVSGGLTQANGFEQRVEQIINGMDFPLKVGKIVRAKDPMRAVAQGCYLATTL